MNIEQLISFLQELSNSSKNIKNEIDLRSTMNKYDMLFLGEKFNIINTIELRNSLSKKLKTNISFEEINNFIPSACKILNMSYETMHVLNNLQSSITEVYQITLW